MSNNTAPKNPPLTKAMSASMLTTQQLSQVSNLLQKLKRRQMSSKDCALETVEVLRKVISTTKGNNPRLFLDEVRALGRELVEANPTELVVGNVVRRILFYIREEYANVSQEQDGESFTKNYPSLGNVLEGELSLLDSRHNWTETVPANFKHAVNENIKDFVAEINSSAEQIAEQAMEHIHANEVILTSGMSTTVDSFLKEVARKERQFEVVVVENAPTMDGHKMAQSLSQAGISTTVITDAAIFAVMARVNKVIVGCSAVLANGGVISSPGMHNIALAAKHHSVPFVVCAGLYKLSPTFPHDRYSLTELKSPADISGTGMDAVPRSVQVLNPSSDYIPSELVDLFLTNEAGYNPSYIYRLLAEYYSMADRVL